MHIKFVYTKFSFVSTDSLLQRVLSRLSDFNETFAEPKLDLHIRFSQEKFNNKVLKIGVFGRLKAGKSTLLNALTHSK